MASAPLGSALTTATLCASVRLPELMFQASVSGPPLATIWSRQLSSLIVDSRAAEPPSRTTTGLLGVSACIQASAARTRLQSAPEAPLAPVPPPASSSAPALRVTAASGANEADSAVALAEHAAAAAARQQERGDERDGDTDTAVTAGHRLLLWTGLDSSMDAARDASARRLAGGQCRRARRAGGM